MEYGKLFNEFILANDLKKISTIANIIKVHASNVVH